ncbi:hypothetical protein EIMP300_07830 [Escherichia coli]|uniref:Uncharacterized protein n=1 Tax=Escherichia coli TaxID=562 RepID=A0A8S0FH45_ECOLX|nr:hypothetical protein EIMP300_07830 [Escherichia coli]
MNVAQAEVLNLESGAKQVLQETFGYQQFRPPFIKTGRHDPARKRLSTPYFPVAIAWSSCPLVAENPFAIKSLPYC